MKLSLQDIQRLLKWSDFSFGTAPDDELRERLRDEEQRLRDPTKVRPRTYKDRKTCLGCEYMLNDRHEPGCPYDGKTHLEKPPQPDEDNW